MRKIALLLVYSSCSTYGRRVQIRSSSEEHLKSQEALRSLAELVRRRSNRRAGATDCCRVLAKFFVALEPATAFNPLQSIATRTKGAQSAPRSSGLQAINTIHKRHPVQRLQAHLHRSVSRVQHRAGRAVALVEASDVEALKERRARLVAELADINRALDEEETEQSPGQSDFIGSRKSVFEPSFGYLSMSAGVYTEAKSTDGVNLPSNAVAFAIGNFKREFVQLLKWLTGSEEVSCARQGCSPEAEELRAKLDRLVLDNKKVWERENSRPPVEAPFVLLVPYYVLCWCLDVAFENRPLSRFWFLETVARMPYFAYVSALHLYETLGWWRRSAATRLVHFAEEWNEFHHLLTMEALGGDQLWRDRFLAQHAAIVYYWLLVGQWFLSPTLSYKFSELIEAHAVDTYAEFVDENRELLAELPAPRVSQLYYNGPDLFLFDEFQTARPRGSRRPACHTLLDVFTNIRDDEAEHVATMHSCQDPNVAVISRRLEAALILTSLVGTSALGLMSGRGATDQITVATGLVALVAVVVTAQMFLRMYDENSSS